LEALPESEYRQLLPHLQKIPLRQGQILNEQSEAPQHAYFLVEGIAALAMSSDKDNELGLSMVGSEGIVGEQAIFKGGLPMVRCVMLTDGAAHVIGREVLNEEFHACGKLHDLLMRSLETRLAETSLTALCNQMHSMEQRLSRWLLTLSHRLGRDELHVTQELISHMLGVERPRVTVAAGILRKAGLIEYSRGFVTIVNRTAMEKQACACYRAIKDSVERA
jgi:CRP-like cAMP-binding protein